MHFLPALTSLLQDHKRKLPVFILELIAGLSIIGWIAAELWSCGSFPAKRQTSLYFRLIHNGSDEKNNPAKKKLPGLHENTLY